MSSVLTKVLFSGFVAGVNPQIYCSNLNPTAFICTYRAMVAYDTYCFLKGDIKTFNTTVNGKITDKKEHRINEIDWVKFVANLLPLKACAASAFFFNCDPEIIPYFCAAGIVIETVADALNWHPATTLVYEING